MTRKSLLIAIVLTTTLAQAEDSDVHIHPYEDELEEDEPIYSEDTTVLTLAQQCVGEVGFNSPQECWLMWHINAANARARAKRVPDWHLVDQLRRYNSIFKVNTPRSRWITQLSLTGEPPNAWVKDGPSWEGVAPFWNRIVMLARRFLNEPGRKPCKANAYGGNCADPKGACDPAPKCWTQVVCHSPKQTPYAQAYYVARKCN